MAQIIKLRATPAPPAINITYEELTLYGGLATGRVNMNNVYRAEPRASVKEDFLTTAWLTNVRSYIALPANTIYSYEAETAISTPGGSYINYYAEPTNYLTVLEVEVTPVTY